ncbi:MAG: aminotransferase class V-fold PLP-dependent enzyme, partial [Clostridiales bacterium]
LNAGRRVFTVRQQAADFFDAPHPERLIFTANTTESINIVLKGILKPGDHVLYSPLEHNAVWRPLSTMAQRQGIAMEMVPATADGYLDLAQLEAKIRPNTKLVCCIHGSNISGAIQPVAAVGALCRAHNLLFLMDGAQTAGVLPISVEELQVDFFAAPAHKGLYGPMGCGLLYVGDRGASALHSFREGGTGSESHSGLQPLSYPDRLESGTINLPGVLGLGGGFSYLQRVGQQHIHDQLAQLTQHFLAGVWDKPGITAYGPPPGVERTPVVMVNLNGLDGGEAAMLLEERYNIAVRAGFHCSPLAHNLLGTGKTGGIRFSFSSFNTMAEVEIALGALAELAAESL